MAKRKRRRYDDKFRASAVVMLEAAGYPDSKGALTMVAHELKTPMATLHRWFREKQNPPPSDLVNEKRGNVIDWIKAEIAAIFDEMPNARPDASFRDLGTVLGILLDKKQLLEGQPTERVENVGHLTVTERRERLASLFDAARDRRDRVAAHTDD